MAQRVRQLSAGIFAELAQRKRQALQRGVDVIDLSIGSPDLPPPSWVMEELAESVRDPSQYGYTVAPSADFLNAVAGFYEQRYGVTLDPKRQVIQVMGSQEGLTHLAWAVLNPGDLVLVPDPGYPIYDASVRLAGGEVYPMALRPENGYLPNLAEIPDEIARRARMMILNYPGNPLPVLGTEAFFEAVVQFAKRHDLVVVHDFAYSELVFDGRRAPSFLSVPGAMDVGIESNSLSKTFSMAGCRIGYMVGNERVLSALATLRSHIDFGVFSPIQRAAVRALQSPAETFHHQARRYQERRDALVQGFAEAGWPIASPPATMFAWAPIPVPGSAADFAMDLMEQTGVAVTPGEAFGSRGEGYVRIALVQPVPRLREAARRVGEYLKARR
ncbi:MAG: aminotransferase class I/II-fold pyridoxal phosphate-dependent enzyme [Alicyclobacillus sp.]|nr:aminotransferase class I/II-fold pyridoxal phosphate-dependent enzyme [Alicyclobacillus sp.]MCL6517550.1 aminotransferase class I/II-fold pyridoxal phosphate-dependent enzyme [Alicyclobacillus sp.]